MKRKAGLRCYMNLMALDSMELSPVRGSGFEQSLETLRNHGFSGVQFDGWASGTQRAACRNMRMGFAASRRVNGCGEAASLAEKASGDGYECCTLHAGWGLEDDAEACAMIESVLNASSRWNVPLYIETHRATICQDMWRTVQFVHRFPEMRFNGDFSHWYTGQEMVYGGFDRKLAFIQPVLDRVRFIHGRISSPGCIQVAIPALEAEQPMYTSHFRQLWTAGFQGFLADENAGPVIYFAPELLAPGIFYARTFDGAEESDRWQQSLLLNEMARQCFTCAGSS